MALVTFDTSEPILGIGLWVKPLKFAISIALFMATMGWLLAYLRDARPRAVAAVSWTIFVTMNGEIAVITWQAARGVRSHFNIDSALDGTLFAIMGALIMLDMIAAGYAAWLFFRTEGGDLRVSHFVGMHALQGLPIPGWLLDRLREARGTMIVRAAAPGWTAVTVLLVWGALAARPLLRMAGD